MKLYNVLKNIVKRLGVDYIVEQGTSGGWTYCKWASGKSECWGTLTQNVTSWTAWGSSYEGKPGVQGTYPSGVFNVTPKCWAFPDGINGAGILGIESYTGASKTTTPYLYALRPTSGNALVVPIYVYALGTWK